MKTIKFGSQNSTVLKFQTMLKALGYYTGKLDSIFGSLTRKAVKLFQKVKNLVMDGIIGLSPDGKTGPAIEAAYASLSTDASSSVAVIKTGSTEKDIILSYQKVLKELGYYTGKLDGLFGPLTKKAVVNFQKANGLMVDGIIGLPPSGETGTAIEQQYQAYKEAQTAPAGNQIEVISYGSAETSIVLKYQKMLSVLGYYTGELDGLFGSKTKKAVTAFQKDHNLPATGEIDLYPTGDTGPAIKEAYENYISNKTDNSPSALVVRVMTEMQQCANDSSDYWYGANAYTPPTLAYLNKLKKSHPDSFSSTKYSYLLERLSSGKTKLVSDCSGFWWGVMNNKLPDIYGKYTDKTAHMTYKTECLPISKDEVRPGDMVFLKSSSSGKIYHVGYVGLDYLVYEAAGAYYGITASALDNRKLYNKITKRWVGKTAWNVFGRPKIFE